MACTVRLDRACYVSPSSDEHRLLPGSLPPAFRFTVNAEQRCVRPHLGPDGTTFGSTSNFRGAGVPNPHFLDPAFAAGRLLRPAIQGFGDRLGPVVFQFPPLDLSSRRVLGGASGFLLELHEFLVALRASSFGEAGITLAVEVRSRDGYDFPGRSRIR